MNVWLFLRMLLRESRGARGRLLFFGACVASGVAAVVGVAALIAQIEQGLHLRSRELLGGDLAVEARSPLPDIVPLLPAASRASLVQRAQLCILSSVVRNERGNSRLAELKAVAAPDHTYPLAGSFELTPKRPLYELLRDDTVLVARAFLDAGELALGDILYVGGVPFHVTGVIEREPDPLTASFVFGPRVLMTQAGLERTHLLGFGHRVRYRSLLRFDDALSPERLEQAKHALETRIPGAGSYVRVESHLDAQPTLRNTLDRVRSYLGLVALLSLLIAAAGVSQIVAGWLAQATPQTAILRCLGLRPREVLLFYLAQIGWLACAASVLGAALGVLLAWLIARAHPELIPGGALARIPIAAALRGCGLGVGMALVFSLPPLVSVWKVSPARVLRAEAEPLPVPRWLSAAAISTLATGVLLAALLQTASWTRAAVFALAVGAIGGGLWCAARALLWCVGRLAHRSLPALLRHGAAALRRPGAGVVSSTVALGMGNLVLLTIGLVQDVMSRELVTALPADAPSVFLLDIQPDQWADVERAAQRARATHIQRAPIVMARLSAVDGRSVEQLVRTRASNPSEQEHERWVLTREQRITSLRSLPENNHIVAGTLWSKPGTTEMSVEADFARDLGAHLGSRLRFDVQGVPVEFEVTSLRTVEWRRFAVSFFLVAEPGALDDAPQFLLGAARVPAETQQAMQDELAKLLPNVVMLRVQELLDRASELVLQLGVMIRLLGGFAVLTGLIILAGSVAATQLRRTREVALLKTLGLTRLRVATLFAVEYSLLGLVAGAISAVGAYALTLLFTRGVLELMTWPSLAVCLVGWLAVSLLSVLAGLLASVRALTIAPLTVFRQQF